MFYPVKLKNVAINLITTFYEGFFVIPWRLELQSMEPESTILSIELRDQNGCKNTIKIRITINKASDKRPFYTDMYIR